MDKKGRHREAIVGQGDGSPEGKTSVSQQMLSATPVFHLLKEGGN